MERKTNPMNCAELFLSGKLFPPFMLLAGSISFLLGRSKKFYEQAAANHGAEHAAKSTKILRVGGPLLTACAFLLFIIDILR
jgi:glycerol-3-phosphate acyltransferase PlsY